MSNERSLDEIKRFLSKARKIDMTESHPYLVRKKVKPTSTMFVTDCDSVKDCFHWCLPLKDPLLAIPFGSQGHIQTWQFIDASGEKRFLAGAKVKGACWCSGSLPKTSSERFVLAIGEVVATVLSVVQNYKGDAVGVVAGSCGNLLPVATTMRERFPKAVIVVLGDVGNGAEDAIKAARTIGASVRFPLFTAEDKRVFQSANGGKTPTDWNDFYQLHY